MDNKTFNTYQKELYKDTIKLLNEYNITGKYNYFEGRITDWIGRNDKVTCIIYINPKFYNSINVIKFEYNFCFNKWSQAFKEEIATNLYYIRFALSEMLGENINQYKDDALDRFVPIPCHTKIETWYRRYKGE